jgi:dTDP-4-amino-4,6-dideoxygalactose transaminase
MSRTAHALDRRLPPASRVALRPFAYERGFAELVESPLHPLVLELHHLHGYTPEQCPNAERCAQRIVNLPLHLGITPNEADRITRFFTTHAKQPKE